MLGYLGRRFLVMIPTLILISIVSFIVIELPPGDMASAYVGQLEDMRDRIGSQEAEEMVANIRAQLGLDDPAPVRYVRWGAAWFKGDWGWSFQWRKPVRELISGRLLLTVMIGLITLLVGTAISWPAGVGAAIRQYSLFDNVFSFIAFFMMAVPNFLFALLLMYAAFKLINYVPGGVFSTEYAQEPWSIAKFIDFLKHIWMPIVILGFESIGGGVRTIRANVLDQLRMPFVTTARAKGVPETRLLIKYPIRMAANPWISGIGWLLPGLVGGEVLVALVLGLPTMGPLYFEGLINQDMQVAGAVIMLLSTLTVIGTLISDLALALLDPRIRLLQ
ncbi:MAG: ABC transporter permease [Spirochaetaceae bacterium]|nr:ABC transporter permease [Spirochaetaceae bacterium]